MKQHKSNAQTYSAITKLQIENAYILTVQMPAESHMQLF